MGNRLQARWRLHNRLAAFGAGLLLVLLLVNVTRAAAPPLHARFFGTATPNSANTPDGTALTAYINGVAYAESATFVDTESCVYLVDVPADAPASVAVENNVVAGQVVTYAGRQGAISRPDVLTPVRPNTLPPQLPASFYGTVPDVLEGRAVVAKINGTEIRRTQIFAFRDRLYYRIDVPTDDPATPAREGGNPGDTIVFEMDGQPVYPTATWQGGTNTRLDLTVGKSRPWWRGWRFPLQEQAVLF